MSKGISPLVAAVLLIATTMSIAGVLTYWATGFVRTRLGAVENVTETSCLSAQFRIYHGNYDRGSRTLYLILENQRSVDLKLEGLYLLYSGGRLESKPFPENSILKGNELKSFTFSGIEDNFISGKIKTNCPDVFVDFTYSQLATTAQTTTTTTTSTTTTT